jgi:hypothetical protein
MVIVVWTPAEDGRRVISMRKANEREQRKRALGSDLNKAEIPELTDVVCLPWHCLSRAVIADRDCSRLAVLPLRGLPV